MIDLTTRRTSGSQRHLKIIGVGGAGVHALDRMALDGADPSHLLALHTDVQLLTASVAGGKIQLGASLTRGIGAGGDPETGAAAAAEAGREILAACEGLDAVFLLAGLGGGTGSGAAPLVAHAARESGALVIAVATLPFEFEGRRRGEQAREALAQLRAEADVVICFENDRMADGVAPGAGIAQAFATADQTISQSVAAINALFHRKGMIHLGVDDFRAAMGGSRCFFGFGRAEGSNRPFEALARALKAPLMEKGRPLRESERVLVAVAGGEDLSLDEVELLMEELNKQVSPRTQLFFSAAVDRQLTGALTVTLFSSLEAPILAFPVREIPREEPAASQSLSGEPARVEPVPLPEAVAWATETTTAEVSVSDTGEPVSGPEAAVAAEENPAPEAPVAPQAAPEQGGEPAPSRVTRPVPGRSLRRSTASFLQPRPKAATPPPAPPEPEQAPQAPAPVPAPAPAAAVPAAAVPAASAPRSPTQETMKFESVTRGRFEKSEPTIVNGEDLDIPTFLRRNIRIR